MANNASIWLINNVDKYNYYDINISQNKNTNQINFMTIK